MHIRLAATYTISSQGIFLELSQYLRKGITICHEHLSFAIIENSFYNSY